MSECVNTWGHVQEGGGGCVSVEALGGENTIHGQSHIALYASLHDINFSLQNIHFDLICAFSKVW